MDPVSQVQSSAEDYDRNDDGRSFDDFRASGLLWLINRTVFHPRGFALGFVRDDEAGEVTGWELLGDGAEPWRFDGDGEDGLFAAAEATFNALRAEDGRTR